MSLGIVNKAFSYGGWNMPAPISAFIATLDWRAIVLTIVLILIDIVIYLPFFKVFEKQKLAEETGTAKE